MDNSTYPGPPEAFGSVASRSKTVVRQKYIPRQQPDDEDDAYYAVRTDDSNHESDFSQFEAVLREIHEGWQFMLEDDFDPVSLTLKLMDDSSVGKKKDYKAFQRILYNLDMALKTIVNDYYRGFNNSIGTFGGVLQYINDSSNRVVHIKSNLKRCKEDLLLKRNDLLNLWYKSQQYKEMLSILETIEDLRTTPDKVDAFMESKQILSASKLVICSLRQAMSKDMMQIGALDDVRRNLKSQKNLLYDTLIEELHNCLYLKTSYCDNRWTAYTPGQQELPESSVKPRQFGRHHANDYHKGQDILAGANDIITEDPDKDPYTDPYYYMELIMESLLVLGEIPSALQTIQERLPVEIHTLVDKTIAEVEQRHLNHWSYPRHQKPSYHNFSSGFSTIDNNNASDENDIYRLDKANLESRNEILKDLLWTLFSKLEAVLTGHRFVETCARNIKKRLLSGVAIDTEEGSGSDINIYHFHEIWKPIQSEIKSLLQDYLTSSDQNIVSVNDTAISANTSNTSFHNKFFSFAAEASVDDDINDNYRIEEDNMEATYDDLKQKLYLTYKKKQIPGFDMKSEYHAHSTIIDKYAINNMSFKGHKVLIKPDAYNVSILLKPTMTFLNRLKEVFPNYDDRNEEAFGSFLDDFAVNVFLPQIEEKVMQLIQHATVGIDAFQDARDYNNYSKYPIAKSAVALISVIQSLSRTMHIMPFHTDEYVRLIEVVLLKFYEKCYQRFYSTVAKGASSAATSSVDNNVTDTAISTSGDWAQDESLVGLLCQNPLFNEDTESDQEFIKALHQAEINMELKLKNDRALEISELIFDSKKHISLGRLYHTIKWFVREIWALRSSTTTSTSNDVQGTEQQYLHTNGLKNTKRWSTQDMQPAPLPEEKESTVVEHLHNRSQVSLPLTEEIAKRFDALLTTYQQLAETCLFTLRIEGRNHTMYYLELAIRDGNYYLEDETFEPDPYIITLNADLMELNESVNASLPPRDEQFVFDGLPRLIVHLLITEATYIKRLNKNGVQKMLRNILALQQNMNNFVPASQCAIMERAKQYYQMFLLGSEGIITSIKESGPKFSFDEYRIILGLIHDINLDQDEEQQHNKHASHSVGAADFPAATYDELRKSNQNKYSEWLMELVEVMADFEG